MTEEIRINPWRGMWTKPRATIAQIIRENPKKHFIIISFISGYALSLSRSFQTAHSSPSFFYYPLVALLPALFFTLFTMLTIVASSGLIYWTGGWIKGKANFQQIRASYTWTCMPFSILLIISYLLTLLLLNLSDHSPAVPLKELYTARLSHSLAFRVFWIPGAMAFLANVWFYIALSKSVAQAQGFRSAWKGALNVFLSVAIVLGFFLSIMLLFGGVAKLKSLVF